MLEMTNLNTAQLDRSSEIWIFSQAEGVDEVCCAAAKLCGEIFVFVLRIFHPQKICHGPATANFTAVLSQKHGLLKPTS